MKKLFAILLTLAMLLSLAACGTSGGSGDSKPTIVGTWKGSVDIGAAMAAATQMEFDEPLEMGITFTYNADGTYSAMIEEDSMDDLVETMVDLMIELSISMSGDPDFDLEAELAKQGMTMKEFREQLKTSMNVEEMFEEAEENGYYKYEDGKIYAAEEKEDLDADEDVEITYVTLTSSKMTITDVEQDGEKMSEVMPDMFPMVFTKQ
jgi:hypothetical protein